jgi:ABC-type antimicrobial peptide transport system permease subunit
MARIGAVLFGVLGGIALMLAVIGIYGVKACAVSHRTREIGIRMAIGAQPRDVFLLFLQQGVLQTVAAIIAGTSLALAAGQMLASYINQVSPTDPIALGGAALLLATSALLACWVPARRAAMIDPAVTLRAE